MRQPLGREAGNRLIAHGPDRGVAATRQSVGNVRVKLQKLSGGVQRALISGGFNIDGWYVHCVLHYAADASYSA